MRRRPGWTPRGVVMALVLGVVAPGLVGCEDLLQEPDSGFAAATLRLEMVSGDRQTGAPGQALPQPLRVRISDAHGRPLSRLRVEWTADARSGRAEPRNSFTDADGIAETSWTLGPGAGEQEIRASLGSAGSIAFQATGTP